MQKKIIDEIKKVVDVSGVAYVFKDVKTGKIRILPTLLYWSDSLMRLVAEVTKDNFRTVCKDEI